MRTRAEKLSRLMEQRKEHFWKSPPWDYAHQCHFLQPIPPRYQRESDFLLLLSYQRILLLMLEVLWAIIHFRHNVPQDFRLNSGFFSVNLKKKKSFYLTQSNWYREIIELELHGSKRNWKAFFLTLTMAPCHNISLIKSRYFRPWRRNVISWQTQILLPLQKKTVR